MATPTVQQLRTAQAALDDAAKVLEERGETSLAARIDRFVATAARGVLAADLPEPEADEPAAPPLNLPTPPAPRAAVSDMAAMVDQIASSGVATLREQMNDLSVPMADLSADVESDKLEGRRLAIAKDVISTYTSTAALIDQMQQQMQQQLLAKLRLLAEEMGAGPQTASAPAPTEPAVAASRRVRASDDDVQAPDIAAQIQLLEAVAQPLAEAEEALMLAKQAEKAADETGGVAGDVLYRVQRSVGGMGREKISVEFLWKATREMLQRLDKEQLKLTDLRGKQAGSVESSRRVRADGAGALRVRDLIQNRDQELGAHEMVRKVETNLRPASSLKPGDVFTDADNDTLYRVAASRRVRAAADRIWTQPANQKDCRVCGNPATTEYQCTKETERAADEGRWTPLCNEHGKDARKHCGGGSVMANRRVRADGTQQLEMPPEPQPNAQASDDDDDDGLALSVDYTAETGQIYCYCRDDDAAQQLEDDMSCIPTGSVERDGEFVYWTADSSAGSAEFDGTEDEKNQQADAEIEEVQRAVEALEKAGFRVEEV